MAREAVTLPARLPKSAAKSVTYEQNAVDGRSLLKCLSIGCGYKSGSHGHAIPGEIDIGFRQSAVEGRAPAPARAVNMHRRSRSDRADFRVTIDRGPLRQRIPHAVTCLRAGLGPEGSDEKEVTVSGIHFMQEDSPDEIGSALAQFVRQTRPPSRNQAGT